MKTNNKKITKLYDKKYILLFLLIIFFIILFDYKYILKLKLFENFENNNSETINNCSETLNIPDGTTTIRITNELISPTENNVYYFNNNNICNEIIKQINIPSSVEIIDIISFAFNDFINLEEVIFDNDSKVKIIPGTAFWGIETLKKIELPNNLEEIGNYAFLECISLKTINLPKSLINLGITLSSINFSTAINVFAHTSIPPIWA